MNSIEKIIADRLFQLTPDSEKLEINAYVDDSGYSFEFFSFKNGVKSQCYDMIDNGLISEKAFDNAVQEIATLVRRNPDYEAGKVNKFRFDATK